MAPFRGLSESGCRAARRAASIMVQRRKIRLPDAKVTGRNQFRNDRLSEQTDKSHKSALCRI
ncbi:protein of unknown function [Burkholderia multivorans]